MSGHQSGAQPGCGWEHSQTEAACAAGALGGWELGYPCEHPHPHSQQLQSRHNGRLLAVGSPGEPGSSHPPGRPGLPPQRPRAGTKARGSAASPQRPLRASGQSRENEDGGPQGNQDAVPALPERKAQPRGARGAGVRGPGGSGDSSPLRAEGSKRGRRWLSGSHPAGPLRRGGPQRLPPGQGSAAYLAGSCAPCCPSLRLGATLAAARTEANYAVGLGPGPGSGPGASRLHRRAGGRQLGRAPGARRRLEEGAEPPAGHGPAPAPAAANRAGRAGPRPPRLLKVRTRGGSGTAEPPALAAPAPGAGRRAGQLGGLGRPASHPAGLPLIYSHTLGKPPGCQALFQALGHSLPSPCPAEQSAGAGVRGWGRTHRQVTSDGVKSLVTARVTAVGVASRT